MGRGLMLDEEKMDISIRERKREGTDKEDEIGEGLYVMPSMPSLDHQKIARKLGTTAAQVRNQVWRMLPEALGPQVTVLDPEIEEPAQPAVQDAQRPQVPVPQIQRHDR